MCEGASLKLHSLLCCWPTVFSNAFNAIVQYNNNYNIKERKETNDPRLQDQDL